MAMMTMMMISANDYVGPPGASGKVDMAMMTMTMTMMTMMTMMMIMTKVMMSDNDYICL